MEAGIFAGVVFATIAISTIICIVRGYLGEERRPKQPKQPKPEEVEVPLTPEEDIAKSLRIIAKNSRAWWWKL